MSHLVHQVCGCDFFVSFVPFSRATVDLVNCLKSFFEKNKLSFYSSEMFNFDQDYLFNFHLQSCRSKIFLFIVDKFSLESDLFLENLVYAKAHSSLKHLPILLPIVFDEDFESVKGPKISKQIKSDREIKINLAKKVLEECVITIKVSKFQTHEKLVELLQDLIVDIIPLEKESDCQVRHLDNFRPTTFEETEFLLKLDSNIFEIMKKFQIDLFNLRSMSPNFVHCKVSIPHMQLKPHLIEMILMGFHLMCIDVCQIHHVTYFNLIWRANRSEDETEATQHQKPTLSAEPSRYLIMFDLNTAQLAKFYKQLCLDRTGWDLELVDSYAKNSRPVTSVYRRRAKSSLGIAGRFEEATSSSRSHEEIVFICQFKWSPSGAKITPNKLKHSIVDKRFPGELVESIQFSYKQNFMPIRIVPLCINVNAIANKHFYYTSLLKPIESSLFGNNREIIGDQSRLLTEFYRFYKDLEDFQFLDVFDRMVKLNYKLVDMKAYRDFNAVTKFAAIWAKIDDFYEGTFKLFVGLKQKELAKICDEMNAKQLFPKLITNYGYLDTHGHHVYAVFFCQY